MIGVLLLQLRLIADTSLLEAQRRAIHWLQAQRSAWIDTYTVGLASALDKCYSWQLRLPLRRYLRKASLAVSVFAAWPEGTPPRPQTLYRLPPEQRYYAQLLWAHKLPLDTTALRLLAEWWRRGKDYDLTHAYLVAYHLKKHLSYRLPLVEEIIEQGPPRLIQTFPAHQLCTDLAWEYLAMWALSGFQRDKLGEYLREAIRYQRPDGGFPGVCEPGAPSALHTTFLAAWALSAYLYPFIQAL
ncbi:MAG: hypothetical protein ABDH91_07795 [Bacteroidia bacterium]